MKKARSTKSRGSKSKGHREESSSLGRIRPASDRAEVAAGVGRKGAFRAEADPARPKYYLLEMLPYPSGTLHMGHMRNYTIGDAVARYRRMRGFNVLHPIGWDAFGLPAENAAIKRGIAPREWTNANIAQMKSVCRRFGFSYDWRREISTCEPEYYRWNQWFFLRMLERGLAYRKRSVVNWCPKCQTVLANEQVVDGCCWQHDDTHVEAKEIEQWFLRTTQYADALLDDMSELEGSWPERVLVMQRNWIGKSRGTRVQVSDRGCGARRIEIFTTRVDTIFGVSAVFLSPAHPLLPGLFAGRPGAGKRWKRPGTGCASRSCVVRTWARPRRRAFLLGALRRIRFPARACRSGWRISCWPSTARARSWPCLRTMSGTSNSRGNTRCRFAWSFSPIAARRSSLIG